VELQTRLEGVWELKRTPTQRLVRKWHFKLSELLEDIPTLPTSQEEKDALTDVVVDVQRRLLKVSMTEDKERQ